MLKPPSDTLKRRPSMAWHGAAGGALWRAIAIASDIHACQLCCELLNHPAGLPQTPTANKNFGLPAGRASARFATDTA